MPRKPLDRAELVVDVTSAPTIQSDKLAALMDLMPEVVSEGRIDLEKLQGFLGNAVTGPDRYFFTWAGKRDAVSLLQSVGLGALLPSDGNGVDEQSTGHVFIEGDNLEALKLIYNAYFGRIKAIYIDPPYNTKNDFVYEDDYSDHLRDYLVKSGQVDASGNMLVPKIEKAGRFHSAWLSMLYPRLLLARQLLTDDGAIFVSIDENEVHNLRMLMNEVFGEENFVSQISIVVNPKGRLLGDQSSFARTHEYLLVYAKLRPEADFSIEKTDEQIEKDYPLRDSDGVPYRVLELRNTHRKFGRHNRPHMYFPLYVDSTMSAESGTCVVKLEKANGLVEVFPNWDDGYEGCWTWNKALATKNLALLRGRFVEGRWKIYRKARAFDAAGAKVRKKLQTIWQNPAFHTEKGQAAFDALMPKELFPAPKPVELIKAILSLCDDPEAIFLDFFGGSGTTGQAVYEMNEADGGRRRFVLVQIPEKTNDARFTTIAEICAERLRRAGVLIRDRAAKAGKTSSGGNGALDFGFRYFRLSPSAFKTWDPSRPQNGEEYQKRLALFESTLKDDARQEDIVWQLALREGLALHSRISQDKVGLNNIYEIGDDETGQDILVCLDDELGEETCSLLSLAQETVFVCRDSAATDSLLANLSLRCNLKTV